MNLLLIAFILFSFQQPKVVDCKLVGMDDRLTLHCDNRNFVYYGSYADWPPQWDAPYLGFTYRATEDEKGLLWPIPFSSEEIAEREANREAAYAQRRDIRYKRTPLQKAGPNQ